MAMVFRNLKILLVLLLFQPAVPGDVIKLKNGKVLEGKILATTRKKVLLEDLEGVRWIKRKDIKSIVKKPWVVDIFRKKLEKVSKRMDKAGILGLLDWATAPMRKKSLEPLLPQLYELVIKVCPDNEKARKALGFVKIGGKWYGKKELKKLEEKKRKEKKKEEYRKGVEEWKREEERRKKAMRWGGMFLKDQIEREREADKKDAERLAAHLGVPKVTVVSSMRISIQGFVSREEGVKLLDLGERALSEWGGELFGDVTANPFCARKRKFHFYLVRNTDLDAMVDYVSKVHGGVSKGDRKFYAAWRMGIPPNGWDHLAVMPFEQCSMKLLEEPFLKALARSFAEAASGSRLMPWLPEGFALEATRRFLGRPVYIKLKIPFKGRILCFTEDISWRWLAITIGRLKADPPFSRIFTESFQDLGIYEIAKSAGFVSMVWDKNPRKLGCFIVMLGYKHGTQPDALKRALDLTPAGADAAFRKWATSQRRRESR